MIKVKRLHPQAQLPTKGSPWASGYDLYSLESTYLKPKLVTKLPLGIATEIPAGYCAMIKDRSGMGSKGIHVFGGVIDSDYRGEWSVLLFNSKGMHHRIEIGDRVAQFLVVAVPGFYLEWSEELGGTVRGVGGFGSTGQ